MSRLRYFTVRGSGNFPFVLLSQDECFPANILQAEFVQLSCPTIADERTIVLASARGAGVPNHAAWKLAKWPVVASD